MSVGNHFAAVFTHNSRNKEYINPHRTARPNTERRNATIASTVRGGQISPPLDRFSKLDCSTSRILPLEITAGWTNFVDGFPFIYRTLSDPLWL